MMINLKLIKKLDPCKDRLDNYIKHYHIRSFTKAQFMGLKNITHQDKLWVSLKLVPKDKLRFMAADIAESVLHIFEAKYPNDLRPRKAIEAARSGIGTRAANASDAAFDAVADAARDSTFVFDAVADAAFAAFYAARAASAFDTVADATRDAANASHYAARAARVFGINQDKLIRKIILKYWR